MLSDVYTRREVSGWKEALEEYAMFAAKKKDAWIFRGQNSKEWGLETRLERALREFDIPAGAEAEYEGGLIRQFKRRAHHYLQTIPEKDNWIEWLSLMQHYGAPTRLQDWTYSFFVALFFAIENAQTNCSLWALNTTWVVDRVINIVDPEEWDRIDKSDRNLEKPETFRNIFALPRAKRKPLVIAVNPYRLNDRLSAQQAVFLCQGDLSLSFEKNLESLFPHADPNDNFVRLDFRLDSTSRQEIIAHLIRMNVTSTTLFPGLDGFARSLRLSLARPEVIRRVDPEFPAD